MTADLRAVAEHGPEFSPPRRDFLFVRADGYIFVVGTEVGRDGTGTHVRLIAEDTVTDVVVMRCLHPVEEDRVFDFGAVPHDGVVADQGTPAEKGTGAHFGAVSDHARRLDECARRDLRVFCDIDLGGDFFIVVAERLPVSTEKVRKPLECLVPVTKAGKIVSRHRVRQIEELLYFRNIHSISSFLYSDGKK